MRAVQFAAAKAFSLAEELIPPINAVYRRRRDMMLDALNKSGWSLSKPKGTMYLWAPVPKQFNGSSSEFATVLLEKTGVVITPGLGYGQWGEGYFRISLTYPDEVLEEAISRIMGMQL
jgi:LL-diaminopimelate aminotransferase